MKKKRKKKEEERKTKRCTNEWGGLRAESDLDSKLHHMRLAMRARARNEPAFPPPLPEPPAPKPMMMVPAAWAGESGGGSSGCCWAEAPGRVSLFCGAGHPMFPCHLWSTRLLQHTNAVRREHSALASPMRGRAAERDVRGRPRVRRGGVVEPALFVCGWGSSARSLASRVELAGVYELVSFLLFLCDALSSFCQNISPSVPKCFRSSCSIGSPGFIAGGAASSCRSASRRASPA